MENGQRDKTRRAEKRSAVSVVGVGESGQKPEAVFSYLISRTYS